MTASAKMLYRSLRRKVLVEHERLSDEEIDQLLAALNGLADCSKMFDRADAVALEQGWWNNPGRYPGGSWK